MNKTPNWLAAFLQLFPPMNIHEVFSKYYHQRNSGEIIDIFFYRQALKEKNFDQVSIEKLLMLLEFEWEILDTINQKIKTSKSNFILGTVLIIPAGYVASLAYEAQIESTLWKVILLLGPISALFYSLKNINDLGVWKKAFSTRESDWKMYSKINENLRGHRINNIQMNNNLGIILISTNFGNYQFIAPGLMVPVSDHTINTVESKFGVKDLEITESIYNDNSTVLELSNNGCLLYTQSLIDQSGRPLWELKFLEETQYKEIKELVFSAG